MCPSPSPPPPPHSFTSTLNVAAGVRVYCCPSAGIERSPSTSTAQSVLPSIAGETVNPGDCDAVMSEDGRTDGRKDGRRVAKSCRYRCLMKTTQGFLRFLFASIFALLGYSRFGAGLVIQQMKGLRPSELLNLSAQITPNAQILGSDLLWNLFLQSR